jgi:hypothetical protein
MEDSNSPANIITEFWNSWTVVHRDTATLWAGFYWTIFPVVVLYWPSLTSRDFALTNSVEPNSYSEANGRSTDQEILCLLWNPQHHCRVHKSPPLIPIRTRLGPLPVHILEPSARPSLVMMVMTHYLCRQHEYSHDLMIPRISVQRCPYRNNIG